MSYTDHTHKMEDPYYWRNKVISWRNAKEANNPDTRNTSDIIWTEEIKKEKLQDQNQYQSPLNTLWYEEGMQIDLNKNTNRAIALKTIMNHIKYLANQEKEKENGNDNIFEDIDTDPAEHVDNQENLKLKALAVSALAEADGHSPDAKKILDQANVENRKKSKTEQVMQKPSPQNTGR